MNQMRIEYYLEKLLNLLLKEMEFDVIVPIERRGVEVLRLSSQSERLFGEGKVIFYESIFIDLNYLKGKRIILFDESVFKGYTLTKRRNTLYRRLSEYYKKPEIKTAALLIRGEPSSIRPDIYFQELVCDDEVFKNISKDLMYKILSQGKPLDVDHMLINVKFPKSDSDFYEVAGMFSSLHELPHSRCFGNVEIFTLDIEEGEYVVPNMGKKHSLYDGIGPKKIRIFKKGNTITFVPVIYPVMKINNEKKCNELCKINDLKLGISLCNLLGETRKWLVNPHQEIRNRVCYNCMVMNLNLDLLSDFLRKIEAEIAFEVLPIDPNLIKPIYPKNADKIAGEIDNRLSFFDTPLIEEKEPAPIIHNPPLKVPNLLVPELAPYLIDTCITHIHKNLNYNRFSHLKSIRSEEYFRGLTYDQIVNTARSIIPVEEASKGMDVALDIGCLTPGTAFKGMLFHNQTDFIGICRLYSTTGEIERSIGEFSRLVMEVDKHE